MTNKELVDALADRMEWSKAETRRVLGTVVKTMTSLLKKGYSFTIPDLGTFEPQVRDEQRTYNPHYKQYMLVPPKRQVDYRPSQSLKEAMKNVEVDHE